MLQWGNVESRTVCALLVAIDQHEITLNEFRDAVGPLTSEALQVIATALRNRAALDPGGDQLWRARKLCSELAAATRNLC
jgi:hypothetical protein